MTAQDEVQVSVADFVRAQGPRQPAFSNAPRCFRVASVLVLAPGSTRPTSEQFAVVDAYRKRWETWFTPDTDGRAATVTELDATAACPEPPLNGPRGAGADAGEVTQDAGAPVVPAGDAGMIADAGQEVPGMSEVKSGCGCSGTTPAPWVLLAFGWALRRRRN
ncbi:MAG: hypothetical protein FJ086_19200 [Deltaproteobacteria bacterium]|nr:hypothetical protein [Deltaproteobacteria bacterium]